jgi:carbamoylphosphate synthase large subunit
MFIITWLFDKLGYMPKIDMQIGKINIDAAWPFPDVEEKPKPRVRKTRALPSKATVAKTAAKTARAKKAK